MIHELKQGKEKGKLFFGIKEALKNSEKIDKVYVSSDCRTSVRQLLQKNKLPVDLLDTDKEETAQQLSTDFKSEVFSLVK